MLTLALAATSASAGATLDRIKAKGEDGESDGDA